MESLTRAYKCCLDEEKTWSHTTSVGSNVNPRACIPNRDSRIATPSCTWLSHDVNITMLFTLATFTNNCTPQLQGQGATCSGRQLPKENASVEKGSWSRRRRSRSGVVRSSVFDCTPQRQLGVSQSSNRDHVGPTAKTAPFQCASSAAR